MSHLPADIHKRLEPRREPQRAPMLRSKLTPDMNLPTGKTCADCAHCGRCCVLFGHIPEDEVCDWSPSRFQERGA